MLYRSFGQPHGNPSKSQTPQAGSMQSSWTSSVECRFAHAHEATQPVDLYYSAFLPRNYTEAYAYPLLAYLHDKDSFDQRLNDWFPAISDQNYVGIGVRAPFPHLRGYPGQFRWKLNRPDSSLATVRDTISHACNHWNIHGGRICLFGEGDGGIVALQHLILQASNAQQLVPANGIICKSLPAGWGKWLPPIPDTLSGRILFLDENLGAQEQAALDALDEAGVSVTCQQVESGQQPASLVNHWIMSGISTAIF